MSKVLVTYFSASGVTAKTANKLAKEVDGDLFEIEPKEKYTSADLNWMDKKSRSSVEMNDPSYRPAIGNQVADTDRVLKDCCSWDTRWKQGRRFGSVKAADLKSWVDGLGL